MIEIGTFRAAYSVHFERCVGLLKALEIDACGPRAISFTCLIFKIRKKKQADKLIE